MRTEELIREAISLPRLEFFAALRLLEIGKVSQAIDGPASVIVDLGYRPET